MNPIRPDYLSNKSNFRFPRQQQHMEPLRRDINFHYEERRNRSRARFDGLLVMAVALAVIWALGFFE